MDIQGLPTTCLVEYLLLALLSSPLPPAASATPSSSLLSSLEGLAFFEELATPGFRDQTTGFFFSCLFIRTLSHN